MKNISLLLIVLVSIVNAQTEKLIPYRSGELWGYCTPEKKIVIAPKYEFANWFSEGLALVANGCDEDCYDVYDGKWGFIDEKGNEVIPLQYEFAHNFYNGTAWVQKDGYWLQINKQGKVLYKHNQEECRGCVPNELSKKIPDVTISIPDVYKTKCRCGKTSCEHSDEWSLGLYHSQKGIEYWDDPETVFFISVDINKLEKNPDAIILLTNDEFRLYENQGKKVKPSLVFLTYKNKEIRTEELFPLKEVQRNDDQREVTFKISDYNKLKPYLLRAQKNPNDEKLMFTFSVKIPTESIKENVFFNIYSKGIRFTEIENGYTINISSYYTLYEMTKPFWQKSTLNNMVKEIQKIGKAMKEQNDSQNQLIKGDDNPYKGRMLFDIMENATEKDILEFLKYVSVRPFIYMGQSYHLSEVFATWLANGAPRVIE